MSKYVNIDGNYKLNVSDGGSITLDTGSAVGQVIITGDLVVQGETTTVNTATLTIEDRIITLNQNGSSGGQISVEGGLQVAGIEIDRGGSDAYWVFDENIVTESAGAGAWVGRTGSAGAGGAIVGIRTTSIDTAGTNLYLINQGTGVVTVDGTTEYEKRIFEYTGDAVDFSASPILKANQHDTLINAKGVVDYLDGFFVGRYQSRIQSDNSYIAVHDQDAGDAVSAIEFTIDGNPAAYFFNNRTELQHIRISDTTIQTTSSNADLILSAPGVGSVKIDDTLLLSPVPGTDDDGLVGGGGAFPNQGYDADTNNPDAPAEGIKLYNKPEGPAGTGLYFVNSNETLDEVVSKKKSILYSMIF